MINETINCPHCGYEQSDLSNGGAPGPWWHNEHCPEGEVEHSCDFCRMKFIVEVHWYPEFTVAETND